MRLITFQPLKVLDEISKDGIYVPRNKVVGDKVFCIKLDENTMENIFITAPSMPQVLLELEVEDSDVETIDYIEWVNYINHHRPRYTGKYANTAKYKEYALKCIKSKHVAKSVIICNSNDPDKVQDEFMEKHYDYIESLSGHKWKRSGDASMRRFWASPEAYNFVNKIAHCMMPLTTLTEDELDEAHALVRKTFIER